MQEPIGFIKDYRKELTSDVWLMPPLYHRVWQYLKYKVNFYDNEIPLKDGSKMTIKKGQHLTSVRGIANAIGWYEGLKWQEPNPKTISTILDWLEKQEMINIERGKGNKQYTLITLNNWKIYQENSIRGNGAENEGGNTLETPSNPYGSRDYETYKTSGGNRQWGNTSVTPSNVDRTGFSEGDNGLVATPDGEGQKHLADIKKEVKECIKNDKEQELYISSPSLEFDQFKFPSQSEVSFLPLINELKIECKGVWQHDELKSYLGLMEQNLIMEALKRSEKKSVAYAMKILNNWKNDEIFTVSNLHQKQQTASHRNSNISPYAKLPESFQINSSDIPVVDYDPNEDLEYQELLKQMKS